jgi:predicted RNA binding protein YcfA (HicA-like mRNA interferase family)
MSNLYSSKQIQKVLEKLSFIFVTQKGSHAKFRNDKGNSVIVPMGKKEIPIGTFKSILRQADLSLEEFKKHL